MEVDDLTDLSSDECAYCHHGACKTANGTEQPIIGVLGDLYLALDLILPYVECKERRLVSFE